MNYFDLEIVAPLVEQLEKEEEEKMACIYEIVDAISFRENLEEELGMDFVSGFEYGLARVRKGKLWGLINKSGEVVLPIQYDEIWKFEGKHRATTNVVLQGKKSEIRLCDYSGEAPIPYWEKPRSLRSRRHDMYYYDDYEDGYYGDDYISPLEAFEGDEDLYNEWLLNS